MTIVVAYGSHKKDLGPLDLACQLGRSDDEAVHAVTVVPQGWPTAVAGDTDRDFELWARAEGAAAANEAAAHLALHDDVTSTTGWVAGRSVPPVLLDEVTARSASMLVVGSGEDVQNGQIGISSKAARLLHSSGVPVAIAPRGYAAAPGTKVTRVTLAFRGDDVTWSLLETVAGITRRIGGHLRVVTFAIRSRAMYPQLVSDTDDMVLRSWIDRATAEQAQAEAHLRSAGLTDISLDVVVGSSWGGAIHSMDWDRGDVLVIGSSSTHRLSRVFLGSSATKILRHSPVPVIAVP